MRVEVQVNTPKDYFTVQRVSKTLQALNDGNGALVRDESGRLITRPYPKTKTTGPTVGFIDSFKNDEDLFQKAKAILNKRKSNGK